MKCQRCNKIFNEKDICEHHIHCRFMDNKKGHGIKIYLCEKCHNILHLIIPSIIWNRLDKHQKQEAIQKVIRFTKKYIGGKDGDTNS